MKKANKIKRPTLTSLALLTGDCKLFVSCVFHIVIQGKGHFILKPVMLL